MSKISLSKSNWQPIAVADSTNMTDAGYMAIKGASSTQMIFISEVYMGGLAIVQSPMDMILAFDGTVATGTLGGTLTSNFTGPNRTSLGANFPSGFQTATVTKPQRGITYVPWRPAFNAFGGIARMTALDPDHRILMVGNAADAGEVSLSAGASSTVGAMSNHIIAEPL